jgi:5'-3' exonuclease
VDIACQYEEHLKKHYGSNVVVVFDGYQSSPNIKDHERQRRAAKRATDIVFDCSTVPQQHTTTRPCF